jgi:hypothetical protein
MKKVALSNAEKVQLLVQPFIKKKDIAAVLECSVKNAEEIFDNILILMKQKNYRILNYNFIPTKLFLAYCELTVEDFVRAATIEQQIKGTEDVA